MWLCGGENLRRFTDFRLWSGSFGVLLTELFGAEFRLINTVFLGINGRFEAVSKAVLEALELSPNGDYFFTVSDARLALSQAKSRLSGITPGARRSGSLDA